MPIKTTDDSTTSPGRNRFIRRGFTLGLLGLSLVSAAAAVALDKAILPYLMQRDPAATGTPYFQETGAMVLFLCRYLTLTAMATAAAVWLMPLERVPWRKPGLVLLILAGLLRLATPDMALNSIHKPDGVHYQLLATSMVTENSLLIKAGAIKVPSRMPIAPSLVMATTTWINPGHFGMGIFSIWLAAIATLWLLYRAARKIWSADAGWLAAILLALSPLHGHFSRSLMGEIPWALATLAAFYLLATGRPVAWRYGAAGLILGFCMLFKPIQASLAGAFALTLAFSCLRYPKILNRRLLVWFAGGGILGVVPLLLYQNVVLGGWLTTGYHLYDLTGASMEKLFSWSYLFGPDARGRGLGTVPGYLLAVSGLDPRPDKTLWYFPLSLLIGVPLLRAWWRRENTEQQRFAATLCLVASVLFSAPFLLYGYQQPRFLLPILPLWTLLMAVVLTRLIASPQAKALLSGLLWTVIAILAAMLAAKVHLQAIPVREPERVLITRAAHAMAGYDCLVTDEDRMLMTRFGAWREYDGLIPIVAAGQPFFTGESMATMRANRSVSRPFEGVQPAIQARLDQNQRVALWLRYPHRNKDVVKAIHHNFLVVDAPGPGLPDWREIHPRREPGPD